MAISNIIFEANTLKDLVARVNEVIDGLNGIPLANTTANGLMSIVVQSFAGVKTFTANVVLQGTSNTGTVLPSANLTFTLGNSTFRYTTLFVGDVDASGNVVAGANVSVGNLLLIRTVSANGSLGTAGQILKSSAAANAVWSSIQEGVATVTLTDGATPALDASLGNVFRLAAAGDRTIGIPSNPFSGQKIVIQHFASSGARTLALNTGTGGFRFGSDFTALTQTVSGKTDYVGAVYNAADNKWDVVSYTKGF